MSSVTRLVIQSVSQSVSHLVSRSILLTALNLKTFHFIRPGPPHLLHFHLSGDSEVGMWLGVGVLGLGLIGAGVGHCGHKVCNFIDNIYFKCTQKPLNSMKFAAVYLLTRPHTHSDHRLHPWGKGYVKCGVCSYRMSLL